MAEGEGGYWHDDALPLASKSLQNSVLLPAAVNH
jgi:hypothetical protein